MDYTKLILLSSGLLFSIVAGGKVATYRATNAGDQEGETRISHYLKTLIQLLKGETVINSRVENEN
jgi:hypothetical protein